MLTANNQNKYYYYCKKTFFPGETFRSLSFQYRLGERTISGIVEETCQALYEVLKDKYLKVWSNCGMSKQV